MTDILSIWDNKEFFSQIRIVIITIFYLSSASLGFAENLLVNIAKEQDSIQIIASDNFIVQEKITGNFQEVTKGQYYLSCKNNKILLSNREMESEILISRKNNGALPLVNHRNYTGRLCVYVEKGLINVNNEIDVETFIKNTLPSKSSPILPNEVIKAQAVAARSYIMFKKLENSNLSYDICADDKELPFTGSGKENEVINKLIIATYGDYLTDRNNKPAMTVTTMCSGGQTESAKEVFDKEFPYLQSVKDFDDDAPDYRWTYETTPVLVRSLLEQTGNKILGKLKAIYLSSINNPGADRTLTGRVKTVLIQGENAISKIDIAYLANQLGLNSTYFDITTGVPLPDKVIAPITNFYGLEVGRKEIPINWGGEKPHGWQGISRSGHILNGQKDEKIIFHGRGKGHGVGLSVWGARGLVNKKNFDHRQILAYYYPSTKYVERNGSVKYES